MFLEFTLEEHLLKPAYLQTLYELIDELNCKCISYIEEINKNHIDYNNPKKITVYGSPAMLNWLLLRIQRYDYYINLFSKGDSIISDNNLN